jgi:hypothetical protein
LPSDQRHDSDRGMAPRNWWDYPVDALELAARVKRDRRLFWREVAAYLARVGYPLFDSEGLAEAVKDFEKYAEDSPSTNLRRGAKLKPEWGGPFGTKPGSAPPGSTSGAPKAPPTAPPPTPLAKMPTPAAIAQSFHDDWAKEFPGEPWPGDEEGIRRLLRAARARKR